MKLYLANAQIERTRYMHDPDLFREVRLVMADSEEEAAKKYRDFWEGQCEHYGTVYAVWSLTVTAPLA